MDLTTSLKSLLLAIRQYKDNRTTENTAQLQRQVEDVSSLKCDHLLSSGQVLPCECVSGLVELAGSPNTSPALISSIINLLAQLACDNDSRGILHSSYNLTSTLASVIHCHNATPENPLVLQCLQVLQKLTYNTQIFQSHHSTFLYHCSQSQNDDIIMPCLGLMANLCRDNLSVQNHIKSLDNVKPFYRTLINFLAHNSLTVVVFTLSILSSLTLNEKVGEKLFDAKNIHQTFQLVFNIIVNGDGTLTRKYSVDLLVDLLKNPKIADYLSRCSMTPVCSRPSSATVCVLSLLSNTLTSNIWLLLSMCSVSGLRTLLCNVVFKPASAKLKAGSRRQVAGRKEESGLALVQWLSSPVEGTESCSLQALHLLHELLKVSPKLLDRTPPVFSSFSSALCFCDPAGTSALTPPLLCTDDSTRSMVSCHISAQLCLSQVESLLSCSCSSSPLTSVCAEALLKTLELMSKLRQQVKDMETSFYRMLQDQRIITPLSLALTSHHRECVQTGLSLLFEATPLPDFPSSVLGESMAANNAYRLREAELSVKRLAVQEAPPPRSNTNQLDSSTSSSRGVHSLVEKIQNGLELQEQVKESHVSEIIDVYAQKISTFASQERRLQDLLEAKAVALSQADRLIAQYRYQRSQAEAEAQKLGSLLKDAERRCEDLQCELRNQTLELERSKVDMEALLQHNTRLQLDSEEHQALKGGYNALLNRFNETERLLKELQISHISVTKVNDTLRKNQEALQLQHDKRLPLSRPLVFTSLSLSGLHAELRAEGEKGRRKDEERKELEETVDVLRKELNKTEQSRKDASIKASSLELQKSQLETKLKQKEDELNKHSAMIAMIHSLSSGKIKNEVNLSL
uniref:Cellular inhibitor of PP2A n=1 Tax=Cynoglossus semilaevis TaxID=244447 RepID=A0A3P8UNK5_CYNSE